MAFSRILLAALVVFAFLVLWREVERRLRRLPVLRGREQLRSLALLALEALLLALFAALWFGSLGAGGAPLLFLVVGALMEVAGVRQGTTATPPWWSLVAGLARIVIAGVLLARMLG
ncbi:MAG TPA: hypothetical protein VMG41_03695 [Gemmatimonadales bacterium]|nr:hypothetical protein [Gemmatimonadales bacterium]